MDFQTLFNIVVTVGLPALGWALRSLYDDIRNLSNTLTAHQVEVATEYAKKDDLARSVDRLDEKLDKILDRLDRKADR